MNGVCVFCGSRRGERPAYRTVAERAGTAIARRGLRVVTGAGGVGLMGAVADAALAAGGEVIGVIPHGLVAREMAHPGLTELHVVGSMHERKALMADLADGFVALPGGFGTLEEFFEVLTWAQLGIHRKPLGLLGVAGFWSPLIALLDHLVAEGFVVPEHRALVLIDDDPDRLLDRMAAFVSPITAAWVTPAQR